MVVRRAAIEASTDPALLLKTALYGDLPSLRDAAADTLLRLHPAPETLLTLLSAADEMVVQLTATSIAQTAPSVDRRRLNTALLAVLARPQLSAATVDACLRLLSPVAESRSAVAHWLNNYPSLSTVFSSLLHSLNLASPRPRALYMPALADVLQIRSARVFTDDGELRIDLLPELAPYTVWNFARLAEQGYLNGRVWNRVVPDFIAQTGDPRGDGWGGPGYTIPDEITDTPFVAGTVAMAIAGPDTGGSQWFITLSDQPALEETSTVFGRLNLGKSTLAGLHRGDVVRQVVIERVAQVAEE
jgi:cyclophilin family peptidyl-prolyl cis-trans isomerase